MEAILIKPLTGIVASIAAYLAGCYLQKKTKSPLANPLLIAALILILLLNFSSMTLEGYQAGGHFITMFIVPATTVLALQIYRQWTLLKSNILPVMIGCLAGCITSIGSVWALCQIFSIKDIVMVSLQPKSVTTAIALDLAEKSGGMGSLTVSAVILTGIISAVLSPLLMKVFHWNNAVAVGISLGTSGHAIGTAKAIELGETEGAMSGIALSITGILTSVLYMLMG